MRRKEYPIQEVQNHEDHCLREANALSGGNLHVKDVFFVRGAK